MINHAGLRTAIDGASVDAFKLLIGVAGGLVMLGRVISAVGLASQPRAAVQVPA